MTRAPYLRWFHCFEKTLLTPTILLLLVGVVVGRTILDSVDVESSLREGVKRSGRVRAGSRAACTYVVVRHRCVGGRAPATFGDAR